MYFYGFGYEFVLNLQKVSSFRIFGPHNYFCHNICNVPKKKLIAPFRFNLIGRVSFIYKNNVLVCKTIPRIGLVFIWNNLVPIFLSAKVFFRMGFLIVFFIKELSNVNLAD